MTKRKRKNDDIRPRPLIVDVLIQFAIFPILGIAGCGYVFAWVVHSGVCGNDPTTLAVNRPLICDTHYFIMFDFVLGSVTCFALWIGLHETKYALWGRIAILLYLFPVRYLLIRLAAGMVVGG